MSDMQGRIIDALQYNYALLKAEVTELKAKVEALEKKETK